MGTTSTDPASFPDVGGRAPDFELTDYTGQPCRLSDLRGSPVVIAVHASHWDPSWPEYVRAYNRVVADTDAPSGARLLSVVGAGIDGGPAVLVIDRAGTVSWRHVGDTPPSPNDVAHALAAVGAEEAFGRPAGWTRRQFVATTLAATLALVFTRRLARAEPGAAPPLEAKQVLPVTPVTLRVNGRDVSLDLEPRVTLLDALREYAGITGPKKGCDHGQCGACTVHVNGRRILSCLTFAVMQQGRDITTIEGLAASAGASGAALHPMQQAFIDHDGFQCGYCTSGQIMSAVAATKEPWGPNDDDVREAMSGNICRCGAYPGIVAAIQSVRKGSTTDQGGRR